MYSVFTAKSSKVSLAIDFCMVEIFLNSSLTKVLNLNCQTVMADYRKIQNIVIFYFIKRQWNFGWNTL